MKMENNVNKICRTCMKNEGKFRSIFDRNKKQAFNYSDMLFICASLKVTEDDELPKEICSKCVYNLSSLYKFRQTCISSEGILKENLIDKKLKIVQSVVKFEIATETKDENNDNHDYLDDTNHSDHLDTSNVTNLRIKVENDVTVAKNIEINVVETGKKQKKRGKSKNINTNDVKRRNQCEICGKFLSCHSNLVQHMRKHTGERPFLCDICQKTFSRAEHLTIHKRIHSGERPHSCETCGKSFVQYAALACHLRTHTGVKPHICPACGKKFAQSVTLKYHMRSHTGEKPFVCNLCGKAFTHSGNLNIHMRFHNNERPFVCTHCGQRFVTSSHLSVHIKHHTGERNHKCDICQKAFIRKEHLRSHMTSHTGQKNHACNLCGKRYAQSSHLNRHMKTHKAQAPEQFTQNPIRISLQDPSRYGLHLQTNALELELKPSRQEQEILRNNSAEIGLNLQSGQILQHAVTVSLLGV